MSKSIEVRKFENELFGSLFVFTADDNTPWFIGRQVAETLGYATKCRQSVNNALESHCPEKRSLNDHRFNGRFEEYVPKGFRKNSVLITEGDTYRLVMNSELEGAVKFQDWVVEEVLPSIKKHGGYHQDQFSQEEERTDKDKANSNKEFFEMVGVMMAEARKETNEMMDRMMTRQDESNRETYKMIVELVKELKSGQQKEEEPEEKLTPMPHGHIPRENIHDMIDCEISEKAVFSLLKNLGWQAFTYQTRSKSGSRINKESFEFFNPTSNWGPISIQQAVSRVVRECLQGVDGAKRKSLQTFYHPRINLRSFYIKGQ